MANCRVYGNSPNSGPGQLAANAARDEVNNQNPTWLVVITTWSTDQTVYTSAVATADQLEGAFQEQFPGYNVVGY